MVEDELWEVVKKRQRAIRQTVPLDGSDKRPERGRRATHLFSGVLRCGACGGGFVLIERVRYGCANARNRGTCANRLSIDRTVLEERVLSGLKDHLLAPELIA